MVKNSAHDITAGQYPSRSGYRVNTFPLLHHVAILVDEYAAMGFRRIMDGVPVPGLARIIDRCAGWKYRWKGIGKCCNDNCHKRKKYPGDQLLVTTYSQLLPCYWCGLHLKRKAFCSFPLLMCGSSQPLMALALREQPRRHQPVLPGVNLATALQGL